MNRTARWPSLLIPLLTAGCVVSRPPIDHRLVIANSSDHHVFVRLNYREPDSGRVEMMFPLRSSNGVVPSLSGDTWESLIRRVGQLTIEFCDEAERETLRQVVVTERDLRSAAWRVEYSKP